MLDNNNYLYIHKDTSVKKASVLVDGNNTYSLVKGWNLRDLLNYSYEGIKNIDRIYENYENKDLNTLSGYKEDLANLNISSYKGPFNTLNLFKGTELIFPREQWNVEVLISKGVYVQKDDYEVFLSEKLKELLKDINYFPISKIYINDRLEKLKESFPKITVWIWSRVLKNPNSNLSDGALIDVSPFISNLTINSNKVGASFDFDLSSLICVYDDDKGWVLKDKVQYHTENNYIYDGFNQKDASKQNPLYFSQVLSENDLVFIRFETLKNEKKRIGEAKDMFLDKSHLPNNIYDLIGLIDIVLPNQSFERLQTSISVKGRDLVKIFIEDGCYFYPGDFISGGIIGNQSKNQALKRFEGKLISLTQSMEKSIEYSLEFIINALSNSKVVPNDLFDAYEDSQKSKRYVEPTSSSTKNEVDMEAYILTEGGSQAVISLENLVELKKTILEEIKLSRQYYKLNTMSSELENTKALTVFDTIHKWIKANLNTVDFENGGWSPPMEVFGELYSNSFNEEEINIHTSNTIDQIHNYVLREQDEASKNKVAKGNLENSPGIWQIIELAIDDEIRDLRLIDDSIGNSMGSIYNYFNKVCQEPFVELLMDTYKDKYTIVARRPPFTYKKVREYLDLYVDKSNLTVETSDIRSEQLKFTDNQAYSMYMIRPQGALRQAGDDMIFAFIKAIHLPEFSEIFGERPLEIHSNYISSFYPVGVEEKRSMETIVKQAFDGLKFLIETNAYLPFTREGQITFNGDRRFKKGTWFYYERTNEVFYIDSVSNSFTKNDGKVDRLTTLNVSRGMVLDYIQKPGIDSSGKAIISYFNIVDLSSELKYKYFSETRYNENIPLVFEDAVNDDEDLYYKNNFSSTFSPSIVNFIKKEEGFYPKRYKDGKTAKNQQLYSIGYGHQIRDSEKNKYNDNYIMSQSEADKLLKEEMNFFLNKVNSTFPNLVQPELDALLDYAYNTGGFSVEFRGKIIKYLNTPNEVNKKDLYNFWRTSRITTNNKVNVLDVLKRRRKKEADLFFEGRRSVKQKEIDKAIEEEGVNNEAHIEVIKGQTLDLDSVVKNIKVNKEVFDFFVKRKQFK